MVRDGDGVPQWQFTEFYGRLDSALGCESWVLLNHLKTFLPLPWLCVGDFNEIVEQSEKEGATMRRESQMRGGLEMLWRRDLSDLGYIGPQFIWCNHIMDDSFTKERLDWGVANRDWCYRFPAVEVIIFGCMHVEPSPHSCFIQRVFR